MGKTTRAGEPSQRGFTLAGLLIILTIVMIFVAYTVPKQWSAVMQRERELQTIYVMRQYARACYEFNQRHKVWPSSFDQLKDARLPRFLRGPKDGIADPLTGQVDWLIIPFAAAQQGQVGGAQTNMSGTGQTSGGASFGFGGAGPTGGTGGTGATGATGATGGTGQQSLPGIPMKDYAGGPFVGVRPPKTGESFLEYRGVKNYEQWSYTALDLTQEIAQYRQGIQMSLQWKCSKRTIVTDGQDMATTAAEFWDQQEEDPRQVYWLFHPEVREYVNQRMTGVSWGWPQLWLKSQFDVAYKPLERGISIGCGVGHVERSLRNLAVVRRIDAYDVSPVSIQLARKHAIQERVTGIHFRVGDAERMPFPDRRYDFAAFNHSLHHMTDPDVLLEKLSLAMKPGAILYVDDYVGPPRHEWLDEQFAASELRLAREELDRTPDEIKLWPCSPPLDPADPSDMIRSDRIVPAIESRFDVIRYAPYWGNFLLPLLSAVDGRMLAPGQPHHGLLARWVQREKELVDAGAYRRPLFAFFVCRNR